MNKNKILFFSMSLFLTASCTVTVPAGNDSKSSVVKKDDATNVSVDQKKDQVVSQKVSLKVLDEKGVPNLVAPEDIKSIKIGSTTYDISKVSITKGGFSAKAVKDISFDGVNFNYTTDGKDPTETFFSVLLKDGTNINADLKNTNANSIVIYDKNTKQSYSASIDTSGNFNNVIVKKDSDPSKTLEKTDASINSKVLDAIKKNPVDSILGDWAFEVLGKKLNVVLRNKGDNKLAVAAVLERKNYVGEISYNDSSDTKGGFDSTLTFGGKAIKVNVKETGTNEVSVTILDTAGIIELEPYKNVPFALSRNL